MDAEPDPRIHFIDFFDRESYSINTVDEYYVSPNPRVSTSGYFNIWEKDELELGLGIGSGSGSGEIRNDSGGVQVHIENNLGRVEIGTGLTSVGDNFSGEEAMLVEEVLEWEEFQNEMNQLEEPTQVSVINVEEEEEEEEEEFAWFGVEDIFVDNMADSGPMDLDLAVYLANIDEDGEIYDAVLGQMFDENEVEINGSPPASKSVVDDLVVVEITTKELSNGNIHCAICKDEILVEEKVKRLPCKHYFHGDCIIPWLRMRNTCPVCRYELPTDDLEYERNKRSQRLRSSGLARDLMLE